MKDPAVLIRDRPRTVRGYRGGQDRRRGRAVVSRRPITFRVETGDTKEARGREGARKRDKREEGHGPATADGDRKGDRRTGDGDRKEEQRAPRTGAKGIRISGARVRSTSGLVGWVRTPPGICLTRLLNEAQSPS
jgi:hypothetical protein